jgi:phospholipase/carboxylesterase
MILFRRLAFGMLALVLMTLPARAEPKQLAGMAYEEVVRGEAVDGQPLPLLVAFHYSGGSASESFENYDQVGGPVRILVPLGAHPKRQGLSYFPVDYYQQSPDDQFRIARETVDRMAEFLEAAAAAYGRKPVVSGISQGGDISLLLAVYHPHRISAAFPFAAVFPDALIVSPERAAIDGPCIVAMQGEADAIVDVATTRARVATLKAGLSITLTTYPGLGHDISPAMKADYTALIDGALHAAPSAPGAACTGPV